MATEPLQLNLGSLRSAMSLTLHTHHASRIWHGRAPAEGKPGIVGLNGFIAVMNKMKRGAEQDDPYSDLRCSSHRRYTALKVLTDARRTAWRFRLR
ncbi:AcaB family transcriptional regulator [Pseudothauera nasutitermitis]